MAACKHAPMNQSLDDKYKPYFLYSSETIILPENYWIIKGLTMISISFKSKIVVWIQYQYNDTKASLISRGNVFMVKQMLRY